MRVVTDFLGPKVTPHRVKARADVLINYPGHDNPLFQKNDQLKANQEKKNPLQRVAEGKLSDFPGNETLSKRTTISCSMFFFLGLFGFSFLKKTLHTQHQHFFLPTGRRKVFLRLKLVYVTDPGDDDRRRMRQKANKRVPEHYHGG